MVPIKAKMGDVALDRKQFPVKLFFMLHQLELEGSSDIVCWQPHGRAFRVNNISVFEEIVLPRFFKHNKMSSFRRQLNIYNFRRVLYGRDENAYYHEFFIRNEIELLRKIERTPTKATGIIRRETEIDPNTFYQDVEPLAFTPGSKLESTSNTKSESVGNVSQQQLSDRRRVKSECQVNQSQSDIQAHFSYSNNNVSIARDGTNTSTNTLNTNIDPHPSSQRQTEYLDDILRPYYHRSPVYNTNTQQPESQHPLSNTMRSANRDIVDNFHQMVHSQNRTLLNNLNFNRNLHQNQSLNDMIHNYINVRRMSDANQLSLRTSLLTMMNQPNNIFNGNIEQYPQTMLATSNMIHNNRTIDNNLLNSVNNIIFFNVGSGGTIDLHRQQQNASLSTSSIMEDRRLGSTAFINNDLIHHRNNEQRIELSQASTTTPTTRIDEILNLLLSRRR